MKIRVASWLAIVPIPAAVAAQTALEPASLDCAALVAESSSLKADLKAGNARAGELAQAQANAQKATAMTAMAGQAAASVVGIAGVAIAEAALEAQRLQVVNEISNARANMTRTMAASRRIQALEAERSRRCPKEGEKK